MALLWLDATYLKVRKRRSGGVGRRDNRQRRQPGRAAGNSRLGAGRLRAPSLLGGLPAPLAPARLEWCPVDHFDAHGGLKAAISQVFTAGWQRCRYIFLRNLLACVPKTSQSLVGTLVRQIFVQPDAASARVAAAGRRSTPPALSQSRRPDGSGRA